MYNAVSYQLSKINQSKKRLKILTTATHESFQSLLSETGHEFYMLTGDGMKGWDFHTKPLPQNHYILPYNCKYPNGIEFDLLFSQEINGLQRLLEIKNLIKIPLVHLTHTMPPPGSNEKQISKITSIRGDVHVFITEFNKRAWGGRPEDKVIYHGVPENKFAHWNGTFAKHGLSVVNYFAQRDVFCGYSNWVKAKEKLDLQLIGENPGLSKSAPSEDYLISALQNCRYFLNTSTWSPIPLSLIEAAMVGCPIITTDKQEIPVFFKDGVNCLVANTPNEIVSAANRLLDDIDLCWKLGNAARATAIENFSMTRFTNEWSNLFLSTYEANR